MSFMIVNKERPNEGILDITGRVRLKIMVGRIETSKVKKFPLEVNAQNFIKRYGLFQYWKVVPYSVLSTGGMPEGTYQGNIGPLTDEEETNVRINVMKANSQLRGEEW